MTDRELALFLNWLLKHYSTTNDGQSFGWEDSIGNQVSIESIVNHYKDLQISQEETLYTEEDMIRMAIHCWSIASKPEYGKTYNVNEIVKNYIKSLKQPKKD